MLLCFVFAVKSQSRFDSHIQPETWDLLSAAPSRSSLKIGALCNLCQVNGKFPSVLQNSSSITHLPICWALEKAERRLRPGKAQRGLTSTGSSLLFVPPTGWRMADGGWRMAMCSLANALREFSGEHKRTMLSNANKDAKKDSYLRSHLFKAYSDLNSTGNSCSSHKSATEMKRHSVCVKMFWQPINESGENFSNGCCSNYC